MPQDAFTLRYLCNELNDIFKGGKINRIIQPSEDDLILTVYLGKRTEKLLISVNPSCPRIGITNVEREAPLTAPNFCMLMRKHLLSATIDGISLVGFDRIVKINLTASGDFFDERKKMLYVELMGRYSNIILTEDGLVVGGNRGINNFDNGVRPLIVHKPYVFPPVNDKLLPTDSALIEVIKQEIINKQITDWSMLVPVLCAATQGIATSTAEEIVRSFYKNCKAVSITDVEPFIAHLIAFLYQHKKEPCVLNDKDGVKDVCVYPYVSLIEKLNGGGVVKNFETLVEAEEYYFTVRDVQRRYKEKFAKLNGIITAQVKKAKKRVQAISAKQRDALLAEENKLKGELILANVYRLKDGMAECELDNYYDGTKLKIALDVNLNPVQNAERYYKKYNKQKRTLEALEPQYKAAKAELDYLTAVADEIVLAETIDDLKLIQDELEAYGIIAIRKQPQRQRKAKESFCREYLVDGYQVFVGRSNTENDLIVHQAAPDDIWLHAKDVHSSHVIIKCAAKSAPPTEKTIITCAQICAYYSKGREGGKTEVVYTQKKHVKKPKGAKPGFVTYDNFRSVTVLPDKHSQHVKSLKNS